MDLDDDIALVAAAIGRCPRRGALGRLPGAQPPRPPWIGSPGPPKHGIAGPRVGLIALAGLARDIDIGQDVVDDPAVARPELDGRDVLVFFEAGRDDEAAIDVVAAGGDVEIGADVDDQVGRAELPVVGELGRRRQVGRVALGGVGLGPGDEGRDFLARRACERP